MIQIRELTEEYVDEFVTTHLTCWDETYTGLFPKEVLEIRWKKKQDRMDHIKKNLKDTNYYYYCFVEDFKIIGLLIFSTLDDIAVLDAIYIKKEKQKKGYGSKLMEIMEKKLLELKMKDYFVYVFKNLPSNQFFINKGAILKGEDYISIHGHDYLENEYNVKVGDFFE